jgi:hypothetical protein
LIARLASSSFFCSTPSFANSRSIAISCDWRILGMSFLLYHGSFSFPFFLLNQLGGIFC